MYEMIRVLSLTLAVLLTVGLCSCAKSGMDALEESLPAIVSSLPTASETEESSEAEEEKPAAAEAEGEVIHAFSDDLTFDHSHLLATEADRKNLSAVLSDLSQNAAHVTVGIMEDCLFEEPVTLTAEEAAHIIGLLSAVECKVFEQPENPATGGNQFNIVVENVVGARLLHVSYDGIWFLTEDEGGTRILDGRDSGADAITEYIREIMEPHVTEYLEELHSDEK